MGLALFGVLEFINRNRLDGICVMLLCRFTRVAAGIKQRHANVVETMAQV